MRIDEALKAYATPSQAATIDAVNKYGSIKKAAEGLGVIRSTVQSAIRAVEKKAAIRGYAPDFDMVKPVPEAFLVKGVSTYYNKDGKPTGQWVKSRVDDNQLVDIIKATVESLTEGVKGLAPVVTPPTVVFNDLMCVYPMGDPHFGLYAWAEESGEDFDIKTAERLTCGAIDRLVDSAPAASVALLLNLGDMFHADNQSNISKSGHQLDVDGRWAKVQQIGVKAMIYGIKRLLEKHQEVIFRINKGNHDGHSSYALALMLSCYFSNEPRVTIDLSPASTWYYHFGSVLIGTTHGDTIKGDKLVPIMAADRPKAWGDTTHRHWYVGHVHHQDVKEYPGGTVEYFRTLAARDAWHAGQGYRAGRDMRLIVLHKEHGEIERHRCDVSMIGDI